MPILETECADCGFPYDEPVDYCPGCGSRMTRYSIVGLSPPIIVDPVYGIHGGEGRGGQYEISEIARLKELDRRADERRKLEDEIIALEKKGNPFKNPHNRKKKKKSTRRRK